MPYFLQMSAVGIPASCSLKMPMICSSLNRELFIIRLLRGDGLYHNLVGIMGLRSPRLALLRQVLRLIVIAGNALWPETWFRAASIMCGLARLLLVRSSRFPFFVTRS